MALDDTVVGNIDFATLTDYEILDHAFNGSDGFKSGEYIVPHWRERGQRYQTRKNNAWYLNVFKPIINAHVDSLYKTEPQRDIQSDILSRIEKDIDKKGNSANVFFKRATREATLQGKTYILVENSVNPDTNKASAIENRDLPYLVLITKNRVDEDKTEYDKFGNLLKIRYYTKRMVNGEELKTWKTWTREKWWVESEKGDIQDDGDNKLGVIPIIQYYGTDSDDLNPISDFFQVAKAAHRLYNLTSNVQEQEDNQMYAVLTLPKTSSKDQETLGTSNALVFDPKASKGPAYISPPVEPIKILIENMARLVVTMYDMSNLAIIKSQSQTSGESKRWDYEKTETVLSGRALSAENMENQVWKMIQLYFGGGEEVEVSYTRKFTFIDAEKEIQKAIDLMEMNLGPVGNAHVKKISVYNAFQYVGKDTMEEIQESIDEQAKVEETNPNNFIDDVEPIE